MSSSAQRVYDTLLAAWGPQRWWPGDTPFEICVGAILTQNTNWKNVELALKNLRAAGALSLDGVLALSLPRLEELIKPAGTFRVKAKRLARFCRWVHDEHGSLDRLFDRGAEALRDTLLEVPGIGPETADSIALYAAGKPTFPADAYTLRITARHGWIDWDSHYEDVREHYMSSLPADAAVYNEMHALLVRTGKDFCRSKPRCEECPLRPLLPESGPVEREAW